MKRVAEKVKDIVEVRPFTHLNDFTADPALTLSGYHFTDITSDLMAKWIDRLADVKGGRGDALALAGFRGVGKSHFLAVIGALVASPELRFAVGDPHVKSAVDRLSRRHNPIAFVRRGSSTSLLDELKHAVSKILDCPPGTLADSIHDILSRAAVDAGELPLVLLIDTELGRDSRVSRDDGETLSHIAVAAGELGIFVGVALDDDIAGADGPNSSISASFSIDYLDQEHLYKVVGANIFAKQSRMLPLLHDLYGYYRDAMPGFRWSEQRFTSLYPLHPATLEIAPIIRLYIHDFALLGFAAEAGFKILGRPANSLIGLDEVFDGVESKLRGVAELDEAFAAFDRIQNEVIAKNPVNMRLPAKLILKGLFLLSLDGRGATPSDIAASMMIIEDPNAGAPSLNVSGLLDSFSTALPDIVERTEGTDRDARYRFRLTIQGDTGDILAAVIKDIPDKAIWAVLLKQTAEKFADIETAPDFGTHPTPCEVVWRGGVRRGVIDWCDTGASERSGDTSDIDWAIILDSGFEADRPTPADASGRTILWKMAELTAEEKDTVRRHHLLQTDPAIREQLGDAVSTAAHAHSIAVDKVWQRVLIEDAILIDLNGEHRFDESVRSAHSLTQLLSVSLAPIFESQFSAHPRLPVVLDTNNTSVLISRFFSTADMGNPDVQLLAEGCAAPLGLAIKQGDLYVPAAEDVVSDIAVVRSAFAGLKAGAVTEISLQEMASSMQSPPFGYTREARQLVAAALVAQRQLEFVTTSGDRINHRSLDLRIVWDDIAGLAKPLNELYSGERLLSWARSITGDPNIRSLSGSSERAMVIDALTSWLSEWGESGVLDKFEALPDENLNAAVWRTAAGLRKTYSAITEAVAAVTTGDDSVEQCLQNIADLFSDSEADLEKKKHDFQLLADFIGNASINNEIVDYLAVCETTDDTVIESHRQEIICILTGRQPVAVQSAKLAALWAEFKSRYISYYVERHESAMGSNASVPGLKDLLSSEGWPVFENLSTSPYFEREHAERAKRLIREIRQSYCLANVEQVLESSPSCTCSFELSDYERLTGLSEKLRKTLRSGLKVVSDRAKAAGALRADADLPNLSGIDCRSMNLAAGNVSNVASKGSVRNLNTREPKLADGTDEWEQEIEQLEVFANN